MQISVYFPPYCFSPFGSFFLDCHCLLWTWPRTVALLFALSVNLLNSFEFIWIHTAPTSHYRLLCKVESFCWLCLGTPNESRWSLWRDTCSKQTVGNCWLTLRGTQSSELQRNGQNDGGRRLANHCCRKTETNERESPRVPRHWRVERQYIRNSIWGYSDDIDIDRFRLTR